MRQIIALILIALAIIDLYAIGSYNVVQALNGEGDPFIAALMLGGVGLCVGVIGFCMLLTGDK